MSDHSQKEIAAMLEPDRIREESKRAMSNVLRMIGGFLVTQDAEQQIIANRSPLNCKNETRGENSSVR